MNKFRNFVLTTKTERVAKDIKKHPRALYHWLNGRASPTARTLEVLVKLGKGAFSYQDIIDCTVHGKK
jgi:hypothetical protein